MCPSRLGLAHHGLSHFSRPFSSYRDYLSTETPFWVFGFGCISPQSFQSLEDVRFHTMLNCGLFSRSFSLHNWNFGHFCPTLALVLHIWCIVSCICCFFRTIHLCLLAATTPRDASLLPLNPNTSCTKSRPLHFGRLFSSYRVSQSAVYANFSG